MDYSNAAESIWAYASGNWYHDGAAGVPYVRKDLHAAEIARLTAALAEAEARNRQLLADHSQMFSRADLAPAAPKVKALVWKWHRDPRDTSEARTTIGSWTIWEIDGSGYCHGPNDTSGKWCKGGLDGAKAAAQADYEARILAALEGGDA